MTCPDCNGHGWILDEDDQARPCHCLGKQVASGVSGRLRGTLPRRLMAASHERNPFLDETVSRHVSRFTRQIAKHVEDGSGLWFHGTVGTGKTTMALMVAKAARDAGFSVAIYSVPLLLADIRRTFAKDSEDSYGRLFRRLTSVDLLLLDDLGAERETEWVLEQLYMLVNERWQDRRSIVVTSNEPDPYRDPTLRTLRDEIGKLREGRRSHAATEELEPIVARLERVADRLAATELGNDTDPVTWMRQQIGSRTVSRLMQMCDEPLLMRGADLRTTAA